ncbi:MAG: MBL fold metallo-hydrolase [Gemmatimonadaceae bacterium]
MSSSDTSPSAKPTRDAHRFRNRSGVDVDPRAAGKWMLQRILSGRLVLPRADIVGVTPDLEALRANAADASRPPALTWIGHATALLQIAGVTVLTDPMFSRFASPVPFAGPRRFQPPGVSLESLPRVDVVLISHTHFDHLDLRSVRHLARQPGGPPLFLVPAGLDAWFDAHVPGVSSRGASPTVRALQWDTHAHAPTVAPGFAFHFLPVQHWTNRSLFRRNDTAWGSWAVLHDRFRFWFAGDLGYSDDVARIGARFGRFDLAAIPIGAYEPRWLMRGQHVNPDEAVQVMHDVGAERAVAVHWGTFALSDEAPHEPPQALARALQSRGVEAERFTVLRHGETRVYAG